MIARYFAAQVLIQTCLLGNFISSSKLLFKHDNSLSEVFVFSTNANNWKFYDWSKMTTVVEFGYHDDALVEFAHKNNVLVSYAANFDKNMLYNISAIENWVSEQVKYIEKNDLDGINIDFEDEINCTDRTARNNFVMLMKLLKLHLKKYKNHAQLSIDFAWSPLNIDNRCYDYKALSEPADLVFIMAYDERSQIFGPCTAWANSPYFDSVKGVKSFNEIGVPLSKIVLGVPWYGYDYDCVKFYPETETCFLREVPFRGVQCSDAAGIQISYAYIMSLLDSSLHHMPQNSNEIPDIKIMSKNWDDQSDTPYFTYLNLKTGIYHQVWYDNYISLSLKYSFARSYGLAGVGFWNADTVEYSGPGKQTGKDMWDAVPGHKRITGHL